MGEEKKVPDSRKAPEGFGRFEELIEYFEKGKTFTQELMRENERLRLRVLQTDKEKFELKSRVDPEQWNRLLEENHDLRGRLELLENRFGEMEKENQDFANRYVEIQTQNDNLLNLYVSSYQLHSTLDPNEVVRVIQEIILNLIGAEEYFICMLDQKSGLPLIIAGEGPNGTLREEKLDRPDPVLLRVLTEKKPFYRAEGELTPHLACTPLKVKEDVVGAISIRKLMEQKQGSLTAIDHELLGLLADHAATALLSSDLYHRTQRKLQTIEGFIELLKAEGAEES